MNHRDRGWRRAACVLTVAALASACTVTPPDRGPTSSSGVLAAGQGSAHAGSTASPATGTAGQDDPGASDVGHPLGASDTPAELPIPSFDQVDAMAAALPEDRIAAAEQLVTAIYGPDESAAVVATAALLREVGMPLVTADGRDVSLPTGSVAVNLPTYVELVPILTRSLREDDVHDPAALADTLQALGLTEATWSDQMVIAALAAWGKQPGDTGPGVLAGAAVRASAWRHGVLLDPSAPSVVLDALAPLLFLAHVLADEVGPPRGESGSGAAAPTTRAPATPTAPGLRRAAVDCADIGTAMADNPELAGWIDHQREGIIGDVVDAGVEAAAEAVERAGDRAVREGTAVVGTGGATLAKGVGKVVSNATTITSSYLLLHGIRLTVTENAGGKVHFVHIGGAPAGAPGAVRFTATASFHSPIPNQYLGCFGPAGVKVPANGPLKGADGFTLRWSIRQADRHALLRPFRGQSNKVAEFLPLGEDGTSTLGALTRRESRPPAAGDPNPPAVHSTPVTVFAIMDQSKQIKSSWDLLGMISQFGLAAEGTTRLLMPTVSYPFEVEYHAPDAYQIKGKGYVGLPQMGIGDMFMTADLYSCDGVAGPWKGSFSLYAKDTGLKAIVEALGIGTRAEDGGFENPAVEFTLDPTAVGTPQSVDFGGGMGALITLAEGPDDGPHVDGDVGQTVWTINGEDISPIAGFWPFQSGLTFHVTGVPHEPRCPGVDVYDNPWMTE